MQSSLIQHDHLDHFLRQSLLCVTKSISFIQEIQSGKWVYYGYLMERYPQQYYSMFDRLASQDLGLMQIMLCCDNTEESQELDDVQELKPLVDFVIDNFGIGKELGLLLNGVKNRMIQKS